MIERIRGERPLPLRLELWDGRRYELGPEPKVRILAKHPGALRYLASPDMSSLGEAYVEGHIDIDGALADILRIAEEVARRSGARVHEWVWLRHRIGHTRRVDRRAISHHYDVSNDFYRIWLDRNMVYSCAYFKTGEEGLDLAQEQKLDHICRKLLLQPGDRFLDIGCGWGALVIWAAQHYGVDATGVTISRQQYEEAKRRIEAAGVADRCRVELRDYRDMEGDESYDKIASVGMFEHVGHKNMGLYFQKIHRLLKPGGIVMNHGITNSDPDYRWGKLGGGRFIGRYVFPHGELPHLSFVLRVMSQQNLEVADVESLRYHYARTLQHWSQRLENQAEQALSLVGPKTLRIYRIYLAGCAHAFQQGWINIQQVLAFKNDPSLRNPLPWTRSHLYT